MYKVFFNEKKIIFASSGNITLIKPTCDFDRNSTTSELKAWFFSFIKNGETEMVLTHPNPKKLFKKFKAIFKQIDAAGGVVKKKDKLLFILRNGKWDLPKGKIDSGETNEQAALREVEEECGICDLKIINSLPSTFHIYQSPYDDTKGQWFFKETSWFEMEYSNSIPGTPQLEEGITRVEWLTNKELDRVYSNTYENLKQIIDLYRD